MAHLIDPCLRATKIANGIRRGIDGISPLSGLVPELRILIQEQKNVLTSLKRTAFEKEEAAKHLAIYAKTEGPDISDTLSKLSILIQKAADLEREYADSLAQSREIFKEIRVAEDENYSVRKRKLDLEQKLSLERTSHHRSSLSLASTSSSSTLITGKAGSTHGSIHDVHPEMQLLRKETMNVENELEDLKRKKIKTATVQQLDALEKLGKELIVIAHYGKNVMSHLDDSLTPAGEHADDRYAAYEGEAKTAYSVKACLDTFSTWSKHEPQVQIIDIDLGDFPKDNKQAMDALLQDLATKSGSDWYSLQSPTSKSPGRTSLVSSTSSSPRQSISSVTYINGVPAVQVINEIPPTPELENGPEDDKGINAAENNLQVDESIKVPVEEDTIKTTEDVDVQTTSQEATPFSDSNVASATIGAEVLSPFVPQTIYKPVTSYQSGHYEQASEGRGSPQQGRVSPQPGRVSPQPGRVSPQSGHVSPQPRIRHHSNEHRFAPTHPPHPLMMQQPPQFPQPFHTPQMYPPGPPGGYYSTPISSMPMPQPHIPGSPTEDTQLHSQPISVSFPMGPPPLASLYSGVSDDSGVIMRSSSSSSSSSSISSHSQHRSHARNPQAVLPSMETGFRTSVEFEANNNDSATYDGPPPDYAEASMRPPAEKREEKSRR
ncbi:hypothetical protein BGZ49_004747 [Haplosporangium sp. Z 27]|nr:hypothetical protein BGZ49_004747 [Haplosporangium sp. Z 27]